MSRTDTPHRVRDGARVIAPFAVAVGAFGVTFGVLARDAGLGGLKAVIFSATTFAGSAQFAATSVLSAGGTLGRRHRRRGAAQHALHPDRIVGGAVAAGPGVETRPARPARRRRVVGGQPPG